MLSEAEEQLKKLIKESPTESLSPQEKGAIKSNIVSFMKRKPVANSAPAVFAAYQKKSWYEAYVGNLVASIYARPALRYVSLVALVLFIGGGSVAFAAQNALPGEFLYAIKTGLNEKAMALTLFSDQAKAEYSISLAQLRLQETETAVAQNKLNEETSSEVRLLFNDHVTDIQNRIATLDARENARVAVELNSQLEALLKAHTKIIHNLGGKKEKGGAKDTENILSDIKNKTNQIAKNRQSSESKLALQTSENSRINAENKLQEAEAALREVATFIANSRGDISEDSVKKGREGLARAGEDIVEGRKKLDAKEYVAAFVLFQSAVRSAQEVNVYVSNRSRLEVDFKLPVLSPSDDASDEQEDEIEIENTLDINNKLNIIQ